MLDITVKRFKKKISNTTHHHTIPMGEKVKRWEEEYTYDSERFLLHKEAYTAPPTLKQYCHTYSDRLAALRPAVLEESSRLWKDSPKQWVRKDRIMDIEEGKFCVVCGTIYKHMPLKPTVLDEYSKDVGVNKPPLKKVWGDGDTIMLEDEQSRTSLVVNPACPDALQASKLMTGMVVGVMGKENSQGELVVTDVCFPGFPPPAPAPKKEPKGIVVLVSGFRIGEEDMEDKKEDKKEVKEGEDVEMEGAEEEKKPANLGDSEMMREMFVEYVTGNIGDPSDENQNKIVRVMIAGDSVVQPIDVAMEEKTVGGVTDRSGGTIKQQVDIEHLKSLDSLLARLCNSVDVDIMPGATDPSNFSLPQQPLNPFLLPLSAPYTSLRRVPNPYDCGVGGLRFLGTSGQPLNDLENYMQVPDNCLESLEQTLSWRHLSPNCPSTLSSFPFPEGDPFLVLNSPRFYFAGNQDNFATKDIEIDGKKVSLICIPSFAKTGTAVAVDLSSGEVTPLQFSTSF